MTKATQFYSTSFIDGPIIEVANKEGVYPSLSICENGEWVVDNVFCITEKNDFQVYFDSYQRAYVESRANLENVNSAIDK